MINWNNLCSLKKRIQNRKNIWAWKKCLHNIYINKFIFFEISKLTLDNTQYKKSDFLFNSLMFSLLKLKFFFFWTCEIWNLCNLNLHLNMNHDEKYHLQWFYHLSQTTFNSDLFLYLSKWKDTMIAFRWGQCLALFDQIKVYSPRPHSKVRYIFIWSIDPGSDWYHKITRLSFYYWYYYYTALLFNMWKILKWTYILLVRIPVVVFCLYL